MRAVADVGDSMYVTVDNDRVKVSSRQDMDYVEYAADVLSGNGSCKAGYPKTYAQMIPRMVSSGTIIADLGQDMPIRVSFDDGTLSGFAMI